jgi:hypothetical protein
MNETTLKMQSYIALATSMLAILVSVGFGVWAVHSFTVTDTTYASTGEGGLVTTKRHPFEDGGVAIVAIPAVFSAVIAIVLFFARRFASTAAMGVAWGLVGFLGIVTVLGALTIGKFVFPTAVATGIAATFSQIYLEERKRTPEPDKYADYQAKFDREVAERQGM